MTEPLSDAISVSLDDYTIDQRGDIGSLVRIEAINTVHTACQHNLLKEATMRILLSKVCGLAVEKLDRVRFRAWRCLQDNWTLFGVGGLPLLVNVSSQWTKANRGRECNDIATTSSVEYYLQMLSLVPLEWVRIPLMEGLVTSAGAGSESVLRSARAAICTYIMNIDDAKLKDLLDALVKILKAKPPKERLLISVLEVLGFLFETGIAVRLENEEYK